MADFKINSFNTAIFHLDIINKKIEDTQFLNKAKSNSYPNIVQDNLMDVGFDFNRTASISGFNKAIYSEISLAFPKPTRYPSMDCLTNQPLLDLVPFKDYNRTFHSNKEAAKKTSDAISDGKFFLYHNVEYFIYYNVVVTKILQL